MGDPDLERLASLVGDVDRFAAEHWGVAPLLRPSGGDFTSLLDLDAMEALLLAPARRPTFRLVRDGETLPPGRSTRAVRLGGAQLDDVADLGSIADAVLDGSTVVLQGLQRTWPPLLDLCRSLERATSHPVQANAYLSPPGTAGLARHHDTHDVLVLQVAGAKRWEVDGLGAVVLEPGDVCYLPAGTAHAAAAQDGASLHITLGILRVSHGHVLRRVLAAAAAAELERPLPLGYARPEAHPAVAGAVRATLAKVAEALAAVDVEGAVEVEVDRARRRRPPHLTGHLRSVLALGDLDAATTVVSRPDQPARLLPDPGPDGRIVLELADRRLRLPPAAREAVERLLTGDPVTVGSLPGLDAAGALVVVRRLVREQLLVLAGGPPA